MSLGSFLKSIWASIKSLFDGLPGEFKTAIHIGVEVVENMKNFVDSPVADVLTAIIPGDIDDKIKAALRAQLPILLTNLKLADATAGLTDPVQIAEAAIKQLQQLTGDTQSAFFHNLSVLVAQVAADGKLTWSDGVYLLQWYYEHQFKTDGTALS